MCVLSTRSGDILHGSSNYATFVGCLSFSMMSFRHMARSVEPSSCYRLPLLFIHEQLPICGKVLANCATMASSVFLAFFSVFHKLLSIWRNDEITKYVSEAIGDVRHCSHELCCCRGRLNDGYDDGMCVCAEDLRQDSLESCCSLMAANTALYDDMMR
jgi:hypothetical protein